MAKLRLGDIVEVTALDHSSIDHEGWRDAKELQEEKPHTMRVVGYYLGEDKDCMWVAFASCATKYSTGFAILKGAIKKARRLRRANS